VGMGSDDRNLPASDRFDQSAVRQGATSAAAGRDDRLCVPIGTCPHGSSRRDRTRDRADDARFEAAVLRIHGRRLRAGDGMEPGVRACTLVLRRICGLRLRWPRPPSPRHSSSTVCGNAGERRRREYPVSSSLRHTCALVSITNRRRALWGEQAWHVQPNGSFRERAPEQ